MDADQAPDTGGHATSAASRVESEPPHQPRAAEPDGATPTHGASDLNGETTPGASTTLDGATTPDARTTPDASTTPDAGGAAAGTTALGAPTPGTTTPDASTIPDAGAAAAGTTATTIPNGATRSAGPIPVRPRDALTAPVGTAAIASSTTGPAGTGRDIHPREEVPWLIIWSAIGVVLGAAAAIELILALQRVVELVVISGFLAVVLSPAVGGLVRLRIRRGMSTTIVFLLGMAAFGALGYLFIHPLYREAIRFANDLPGTLARVQAGKGHIGSLIARYHLQNDAATYIPKIRNYLSHLGGPALSAARTVLSGLGGLMILSVITFLLLLEGPSLVRGVLRVLPAPQARRVRRILDDVAKSVTGYVIGNFATSVIAGAVCGTALILLRVPFAVVFGVWVALVDLIPLVGGLLAGVPTVAFAFLYSPTAGIITLIVFLVYQQLENHLLNPLIMSRTVKLNPLWVLLSVLAGAELAGFVGALLAIPAAGTIHVIARDIWDERRGRLKPTMTVGPDQTPIP